MGIQYEKDTILNWINEIGKYLRLLVDSYDTLENVPVQIDIEQGYRDYFLKDRGFFTDANEKSLFDFLDTLEAEKVRPLAQLLMYDGLIQKNKDLLSKSKKIFERNMQKTGAFSFEDYNFLAKIDSALLD